MPLCGKSGQSVCAFSGAMTLVGNAKYRPEQILLLTGLADGVTTALAARPRKWNKDEPPGRQPGNLALPSRSNMYRRAHYQQIQDGTVGAEISGYISGKLPRLPSSGRALMQYPAIIDLRCAMDHVEGGWSCPSWLAALQMFDSTNPIFTREVTDQVSKGLSRSRPADRRRY